MELKVTAEEAAKSARQYQQKMNNGRVVPPIPRHIIKAQEEKVHIFSVSPWDHHVAMGSWGTFIIPKCPEGKPYIEFLMPDPYGGHGPIPGVLAQTYVKNESELDWFIEDGRDWANRLVGNDPGTPAQFSLNRFGVFVAVSDKPNEDEIIIANIELETKLSDLVREANEWWPDPVMRKGIKPEVHHLAAHLLHLDGEEWMRRQSPQGRQKCPMCGTFSDQGVIECGNCRNYVFDYDAKAALEIEQEERMEAAKAKLHKKADK